MIKTSVQSRNNHLSILRQDRDKTFGHLDLTEKAHLRKVLRSGPTSVYSDIVENKPKPARFSHTRIQISLEVVAQGTTRSKKRD